MADTGRGIVDNIVFARGHLEQARKDGGCEQIVFWTRRVDQLLEQLFEQLSGDSNDDPCGW